MAEPLAREIEAAPTAPGIATTPLVVPERRRPWLSPLNQRRWRNFKKNRRAYWSMWIFAVLFGLSLFAEFIANNKPIVVRFQGELFFPIFQFYPETTFGGDFRTEAVYRDVEVRCLIMSGGLEDCFDTPEEVLAQVETGVVNGVTIDKGWMLWPLIPYRFDTINDIGRAAPSPPDANHWLGTDDTARDVLARVIYGFRLSILFTLIVTTIASIIGIVAGAFRASSAAGST
jgi:microcin C transport system permease protein